MAASHKHHFVQKNLGFNTPESSEAAFSSTQHSRRRQSLPQRTNPQFAQIYHPTYYYHLFNYIIPRCLSDTLCFTAFFIFNFTTLENLDELPTFYFFAHVYFHCKGALGQTL